jgi:hypothetical protein
MTRVGLQRHKKKISSLPFLTDLFPFDLVTRILFGVQYKLFNLYSFSVILYA